MIEMIGNPRSRNHRALAAECAFERREAHKEFLLWQKNVFRRS